MCPYSNPSVALGIAEELGLASTIIYTMNSKEVEVVLTTVITQIRAGGASH